MMWPWKRHPDGVASVGASVVEARDAYEAARRRSLEDKLAAMRKLTDRVLPLRNSALSANLEPFQLLFPSAEASQWWCAFGLGEPIFGMTQDHHDGPLTLLAKPAKIGRYQVVIPTRFEEAA